MQCQLLLLLVLLLLLLASSCMCSQVKSSHSPAPTPPPCLPGASAAEAVKFINHRDGMVRTAVKTLTLNVFGIPLPVVQQFVTSRPASHYFSELATYVAEQCQVRIGA